MAQVERVEGKPAFRGPSPCGWLDATNIRMSRVGTERPPYCFMGVQARSGDHGPSMPPTAKMTRRKRIFVITCPRNKVCMRVRAGGIKQKTPPASAGGVSLITSLTITYFHTGCSTIIGAKSFHGPVRDGKGWDRLAMVIRL